MMDPMIPEHYRVENIHKENKDTFTLNLAPFSDSKACSFEPGQFNMIYVYGVGEIPISISGDPAYKKAFKHTTRIVGTVTKAIGQLKEGEQVGIRGPFGSHWPVESLEGRDVVILAGGIGLAPLRPAIYQILKERKKYEEVVLLYGSRDPGDLLFKKELKAWEKSGLKVYVTVDRAFGKWSGNVGVVTTLIPRAPFDPLNSVAMVCGPEIMMRYTIQSIIQRGVQEENIYLSMERNMKCAIGFCGHCQYGHYFVCKDGPVFRFPQIKSLFRKAEI